MNDDDHKSLPASRLMNHDAGANREAHTARPRGLRLRLSGALHLLFGRRPTLQQAVETLIHDAPPVDAAQQSGVPLTPGLIANVLSLREKTVSDCLTPRADIIAIEIATPLSEVVQLFVHEAHTRVPVYRGRLDDVVGMVHMKDVFRCLAENSDCKLKDLLREVLFVPAAMPVGRLLLMMKQKRQHLAMVVDEFGGIDGLVTFEDLLEEIIGEVEDEHDDADVPLIVARPDGTWLAEARAPLETLADFFGTALGDLDDNVDTLGGLVFSLAGRIPARGEIVRHPGGLLFEIVEADAKRIRRVIIRTALAKEAQAKEIQGKESAGKELGVKMHMGKSSGAAEKRGEKSIVELGAELNNAAALVPQHEPSHREQQQPEVHADSGAASAHVADADAIPTALRIIKS